MTEKTLAPIFRSSKKKSGEIARLIQFMESKKLQPIDIASNTDVSERTVKNCIYDELPIGGKLLRALHLKYGVSIDWLLSGSGTMFSVDHVREARAVYKVDNERLARIISEIDDWLIHANEDEKVWLELDIRRHLKQNWPPVGS